MTTSNLQDLPTAVRKIANFLQIKLSEEHVAAVVKANTFKEKKQTSGFDVKLRKGESSSCATTTYTFPNNIKKLNIFIMAKAVFRLIEPIAALKTNAMWLIQSLIATELSSFCR